MKKTIFFVLATMPLAFANNSFGSTIMGTADMKDNGDGTTCLTCPGGGCCYRHPVTGHAGSIYIYKNGDPNSQGYGWYEVVGTCQAQGDNDDPIEWNNMPVIVNNIEH